MTTEVWAGDCPIQVVLAGEPIDCTFPRGHELPHSWAIPATECAACDTTTRAQEIWAELFKIVPYPDTGTVTARSLARWLALDAQLAYARVTGMDHPITEEDIAILQGNFAAAHALLALTTAEPGDADAVAREIREAFDPPGIGEWLWEHLGDDAERIAELAEELARVTAPAEAGEVARLKAELSRTQSAAQTLGKIVTRMAQSMEAARIEMIQNGPEAAMEWIVNSLPDVSDEAPQDQWDGNETATQWMDRTQAADRAAAVKP